jgi:hypothetical protein
VLLLAGCAASGSIEGRYAGTVDVTAGVCGLSPGGAKQTKGTLMIKGDEVLFAPDEGVAVLRGKIDGSGHLTASETGPGVDHKPFPMVFEGDLRDGKVAGRYSTPRCRAVVELARVG